MSPETYENAVKWRRDMTKIEITGHVIIHTDINLAKKRLTGAITEAIILKHIKHIRLLGIATGGL